MPHGECYLWVKELLALHVLSDGLMALAYYSIPLGIFYFLRRRGDAPFPLLFLMFGAFIFACGTTHLFDVITIWQPEYWVAGWIKAASALISVATAFALIRVMPQALQLPSAASLQQVNRDLQQSAQTRMQDLSATNDRLEREIRQREAAESEVRRLNQSLEHRLHEMQALLDLLPVGIGIAQDVDCREIRTNRLFAEMLGIPQQQNASLSAPPIEAPPFTVLQNGKELKPEELPMQRAAKENRPILDFEETIRRHDGRELQVVVNVVPLRDAAGHARGCVAAVQDVTAQKLASQERLAFERRLQETQKLESLGVLAGGIAHDFNNLLTGILGNASIARLELPPGHAPVRLALDHLEQAAMRAADLCKQMLAYAGKGRFVVQPLGLSRLVKETTELLDVSIGKKVAMQLQLAEGLPAFQGDATQIRQVLMNLVINASEAIGDKTGIISIRTSVLHASADYLERMAFCEQVEEGRYVCLEVSDTGVGMDKATLARIFDPFFTTKFTGRGLGLAAAMGIVRGHKGALKVYSEPGRGTTFKLLFPALGQQATPPDLVARSTAVHRYSGTILIADDEEAVRTVATRVLRNAGFKVLAAADGFQAVDLVRETKEEFALVLLDLTMPRMDGEEAFRLMRQMRPGLRVVIMSGFNEQDTTHRFVGRGLAGFMPKPFTAEMLLGKVSAVLKSAIAN